MLEESSNYTGFTGGKVKLFKRKLIERENKWDIKISDFIFEHIQTEKLFCDLYHPTAFLLGEITRRILLYLSIDVKEIPKKDNFINNRELFIYKDVRKALKMEFKDDVIRVNYSNNKIHCENMNIDDYISYQIKMYKAQKKYKNKSGKNNG